MNEDSSSRVLFRLQHLIPRLLPSVSLDSKNIQNTAENPQEIKLDLTWGKICGNIFFSFIFYKYKDST